MIYGFKENRVASVFHTLLICFISFTQVLFSSLHFKVILVPHRNTFHKFARYKLSSERGEHKAPLMIHIQ
jgi:hypothetical protein